MSQKRACVFDLGLISSEKLISPSVSGTELTDQRGSLAFRETLIYVMAYSVLTATYSITWNTLNLTDTLLSSQACIFYRGMHSRKMPQTQLN